MPALIVMSTIIKLCSFFILEAVRVQSPSNDFLKLEIFYTEYVATSPICHSNMILQGARLKEQYGENVYNLSRKLGVLIFLYKKNAGG